MEKWAKYAYIPLDIPRFNFPNVVKWFFETALPLERYQYSIATEDSLSILPFNAVDIFAPGDEGLPIYSLNPHPEFVDLFPELIEQVLAYFPFTRIRKMRLWNSSGEVAYHRDGGLLLDAPNSFRVMLYDENPTSTFGFIPSVPDEPDDFSNNFLYPRIEETNSFVWNNVRTKHGSVYDPKYRKIILIFDTYGIDFERYDDLMQRSINKYPDNLLICDGDTSKYLGI